MKKKGNTTILAFLTFLVSYGVYDAILNNVVVDILFYIGCSIVIVLWYLNIKKKTTLFKKVLGLGLVLGTLNFIDYSQYKFGASFKFSPGNQSFTIGGFNPLIFVLLLAYIYSNSTDVFKLYHNTFVTTDEEKNQREKSLVNTFEKKLASKEIPDLKEIVANPDKYQKEFVLAARNLLMNKNVQ